MGMTKTAALPKTQAAALEILKSLGGQASYEQWGKAGANLNAIGGLHGRGLVAITRGVDGGTYRIV